jgi:hypothetical protein
MFTKIPRAPFNERASVSSRTGAPLEPEMLSNPASSPPEFNSIRTYLHRSTQPKIYDRAQLYLPSHKKPSQQRKTQTRAHWKDLGLLLTSLDDNSVHHFWHHFRSMTHIGMHSQTPQHGITYIGMESHSVQHALTAWNHILFSINSRTPARNTTLQHEITYTPAWNHSHFSMKTHTLHARGYWPILRSESTGPLHTGLNADSMLP